MKKSFIGAIVLGAWLTSCCGGGTCSTQQPAPADSIAETSAQTEEVYSGVIPAASAGGMEMTLRLRTDGTFSEVLLAQQAGAVEEVTEGRFELRGDTLILTRAGEVAPMRALLGAERLRLLDADGNLPELPYELTLQR